MCRIPSTKHILFFLFWSAPVSEKSNLIFCIFRILVNICLGSFVWVNWATTNNAKTTNKYCTIGTSKRKMQKVKLPVSETENLTLIRLWVTVRWRKVKVLSTDSLLSHLFQIRNCQLCTIPFPSMKTFYNFPSLFEHLMAVPFSKVPKPQLKIFFFAWSGLWYKYRRELFEAVHLPCDRWRREHFL